MFSPLDGCVQSDCRRNRFDIASSAENFQPSPARNTRETHQAAHAKRNEER